MAFQILGVNSVILVVFASFFVGLILHKIAKSELKIGRKYLTATMKILPVVFFTVFIVVNYNNLMYVLVGTIFLLAVIFYNWQHREKLHASMFGAILFLSVKSESFLFLSSTLLLFGLVQGTLIVKKSYKEAVMRLIFDYGWMVVVFFLLALIFG